MEQHGRNQQAHVLRSSDAPEVFLDLLELEFCSFVFERYLILLRCFNLDKYFSSHQIFYGRNSEIKDLILIDLKFMAFHCISENSGILLERGSR